MPVSPDDFRAALRCFPSGVTVVTAVGPEGPVGMTASAFCSLSLEPPQILVCVGQRASLHPVLAASGRFAVSLLADDQQDLSNRFAGRGQPGQDRFAGVDTIAAPEGGAPWLTGALANLDCLVRSAFDGGDHTIFVGEVVSARVNPDRDAASGLLYSAGRYRRVGDAL